MEWLTALDIRMVLILAGVLLVARAGATRGRWVPGLLRDTLVQVCEISLVSVVVVFLVLHRFLFQLFFIPSGSMIPTLAIQDRILVNKWAYQTHAPRRGEVVVFQAPPAASEQPCHFIKRVIGLPGETVSVTPDTLYLDGQPLAPILLASEAKSARDGLLVPDEAEIRVDGDRLLVNGQAMLIASERGQVRLTAEVLTVDGHLVRLVEPEEAARLRPLHPARDGVRAGGTVVWSKTQQRLLVVKGRQLTLRPGHVLVNGQPLPERYVRQAPRYSMASLHLGARQYFVLGDNRNNSKDSHYWGALDGARIEGRAEAICWPLCRAGWLGDGGQPAYAAVR